ncbi:uncharacterized protein LOC111400836 [Olea europaea var. sylvestris]|uniref:Uncharacterized protein n=1 Tax=Olea europaea subsp. europaea TaxID=158383 RepID=A0A8S0P6Q0_OLEEU|nr:uncharacterized protein LOC111400836 [Olea europaea var. sylvestris]CAA2933479.1 Hypothetical predicted protein [Olea europaea subsp. europaea]
MNSGQEDIGICPSFNCYSADGLAEIAVQVSKENSNEDDEDFEFSLVSESKEVLTGNSEIKSIFPIFNRDLLVNNDEKILEPSDQVESIKVPLSKLFIEDRGEEEREIPSSSSSEADELESVPAGTYCVWRPKATEPSPSRCRKSKSTGSRSRRWKLRDLMRRSNSDGKDSFVFLTPKHREEKPEKIETSKKSKAKGAVLGGPPGSSSAHEAHYIRNRAIKEENKKKSYLPYRRDLVGFFANVNVLGRSFAPM